MKKILISIGVIILVAIILGAIGSNINDDENKNNINSPLNSIVDENALNQNNVTIDYNDASSFENALNSGIKVNGKTVKFEVKNYEPNSAMGINCWAGEHLNFISDNELDVKSGDFIVGRVKEEPTKFLGSWTIKYDVIEIQHNNQDNQVEENTTDDEISQSQVEENTNDDEISQSQIEEKDEILTIDNCPELANILTNNHVSKQEYIEFFNKYEDRIIEFDGNVSYIAPFKDYETRYELLISYGDFDANHQIGPTFKIEDVNSFDLGLTAYRLTDQLPIGANIHIKAKLTLFDSDTSIFYLDPIEFKRR